ncbi:Amino-transferase class IV [uncultured archaeon]|nr:Amino-transferase class IV [uncultured archaeon]
MPLTEVEYIWLNGKIVPWKDAKIHVLTHALHYGSGAFEGVRCYETKKGPAVFRLTDHLKRLESSAKIYMMDLPYGGVDGLKKAVFDVIKANKLKSCYIRPIVYRGYGEMGVNPLKSPVEAAVAVWPWGAYLGDDGLKNGIRVRVSSYRRIDANVIPPRAKATGQYLNSILAKIEAIQTGVDEAVMLDSRGMVSECSGENLFIVRKGKLFTPPTSAGILEGITRDSVLKIAKDDLGLKAKQRDISRDELYLAEEAFLTGTAAEITPIREIDGRTIGKPGPITKQIQEKFFSIVKGNDEKYAEWLEHPK